MNVSNLRSTVLSALIVFELFFLQPVLGGPWGTDHLIQVQLYFKEAVWVQDT